MTSVLVEETEVAPLATGTGKGAARRVPFPTWPAELLPQA